jgi:hypothetical protein
MEDDDPPRPTIPRVMRKGADEGESAHVTRMRVDVARRIAHLSPKDLAALSDWLIDDGPGRIEEIHRSLTVFMRGDGPYIKPDHPVDDTIQSIALAIAILINDQGGVRKRHPKRGSSDD